MIVVVEGIDRVGKTTLVKKLEENGFISLKDEFVIDHLLREESRGSFRHYSVGKCESFVIVAKQLNEKGYNVVIDRLHLTELVYGTVKRNSNINEVAIWGVDMMLANLNAMLCYVSPSDLELTNELAGEDQSKLDAMFEHVVKLSNMRKITCKYTSIESAVAYITKAACVNDFYFASPFFNDEQVEREERMIAHLRGMGFKVFSPKEACNLDSKASQQSREEVFKGNCDAIRSSRAVFAVTDGKDMGTIWEAGFAYGIGKPVIYFAETLGDNQFNLMLAQSGRDVFTSQGEVTVHALFDILDGKRRDFRGDIE